MRALRALEAAAAAGLVALARAHQDDGIVAPSAEQERADPKAADGMYASAGKMPLRISVSRKAASSRARCTTILSVNRRT